jgi:glycosyltransferase involved in cell wall biosynthesis
VDRAGGIVAENSFNVYDLFRIFFDLERTWLCILAYLLSMNFEVTLVLNCLRSGGAEKQLLWIASEIVSMGIGCSILELSSGASSERIEAMVRTVIGKGVRVLRAPKGTGNIRGLLRLRRHLSISQPTLIWSWGIRADTICYLSKVLNTRSKWIISCRSANTHNPVLNSVLKKLFARHCDGIVSNTHAGLMLDRYQEISGLRCWVLPNAVTLDSQSEIVLPVTPPEVLVLVMLGNIKVKIKGYDLAAQIAQILRDKCLQFELRIAGRPDELEELEEILRRLKLQSTVKYYGEVSHPEKFLRAGHLFLLLSRHEGMPNTLLEALNVGLPAIVTDVGDLRVHKEEGAPFFLIPVESISAAVNAIEMAIVQWSETRKLAATGRSWVQKKFSDISCRAVLRNILTEILET